MKALVSLSVIQASILPMLGTSSAAPAEDHSAVMRDADVRYAQVVRAARAVLSQVPSDATSLSGQQASAFNVVKVYRDTNSVPLLLKLVFVENPEKREWWRQTRSPVRARIYAKRFQDRPAAEALVAIGLPSVDAIVREINDSGGKMDSRRLNVYGEILYEILNYHCGPFLKVEQGHAPLSAVPLYDKLLEIPDIKHSNRDFRQGEPDDTSGGEQAK